MKSEIRVQNVDFRGIRVTFPYNPFFIEKIKTIARRRWHPEEKYWSFPNEEGTLEIILKVFEEEQIYVDPLHILYPLVGKGEGYNFEDLRRELLSRKYSYKTVKSYLYYNKDFLNFFSKHPVEINDEDIKDYLLHLVEEKEAATSTLNQAINALRFYYGTVLGKKFLYEVKRPRKDKKLSVVLSQEEVVKILNSVDNIKHKVMLMLIYSAGLRVGEVVRLRPEDIDSKRMLIYIKGSKGRKDQYTILSCCIGGIEGILDSIQA